MNHFYVRTLRGSSSPLNSLYLSGESGKLFSLDNDLNLVSWNMDTLSRDEVLETPKELVKKKPDRLGLLFFKKQFCFWIDGSIYDSQGNLLVSDGSPYIRPLVFNNHLFYPSRHDDSILNILSPNGESKHIKFSRMIIDICHNEVDLLYVLDDAGLIYCVNDKDDIIWKETIKVAGVCTISAQGDDLVVGTASGHLYHYNLNKLKNTKRFESAIRKVFIESQFIFISWGTKNDLLIIDAADLNLPIYEIHDIKPSFFQRLAATVDARIIDPIDSISYKPLIAIGCESLGVIRILSHRRDE
jgi:outer membrane protein assembly factor BamB